MAIERTFSTAEICELFGISKSTLFRWERDRRIPTVPRDANGQRRYSNAHLQAIAERLRERYKRQFAEAANSEDTGRMQTIAQTHSFIKFLQGEPVGLQELEAYDALPPHLIRHLTRILADYYTPDDPEYCGIIRVLAKQCRLKARSGLRGTRETRDTERTRSRPDL